jgi:phospholipase C
VIVIIGENRTFDHVFATYKQAPATALKHRQRRGTPDPILPGQPIVGIDTSTDGFQMSPSGKRPVFDLAAGAGGGYSSGPFPDVATAKQYENGLPDDYYVYLTTGGTGLSHGAIDTRSKRNVSPPVRSN